MARGTEKDEIDSARLVEPSGNATAQPESVDKLTFCMGAEDPCMPVNSFSAPWAAPHDQTYWPGCCMTSIFSLEWREDQGYLVHLYDACDAYLSNRIDHCLGHFITRLAIYFGQHPPIQRSPTAFPHATTGSAPCAGPASPGGSRGNAERALGAFLSDKTRRWESDSPPPPALCYCQRILSVFLTKEIQSAHS
ncbi:hypothetical protein LA080_007771 [Diaporthe eres]|nr:hypothetical protein LA080_007771 [Diaporthe eres]